MSEVPWPLMAEARGRSHLIAGLTPLVPIHVAPGPGSGADRRRLLAGLAAALELRDRYAIAVVPETDGNHVHCACASARDAVRLAEVLGAMKTDRYEGWASQRIFPFDAARAAAISLQLERQATLARKRRNNPS